MREIKFRYWDGRATYISETLASGNELFVEPDVQAIMQYTGLKDKNGKEIYEGDIVKFPAYPTESNPMGEPFFGIVIYQHGAFCYQYESLYCESLISLYDGDEAYEEEVIGNIYENPELIKEA